MGGISDLKDLMERMVAVDITRVWGQNFKGCGSIIIGGGGGEGSIDIWIYILII